MKKAVITAAGVFGVAGLLGGGVAYFHKKPQLECTQKVQTFDGSWGQWCRPKIEPVTWVPSLLPPAPGELPPPAPAPVVTPDAGSGMVKSVKDAGK